MIVKKDFKNISDLKLFLKQYDNTAEKPVDFVSISIHEHIDGSLTERDFETIKEELGVEAANKVRSLYIAKK